MQRYEKILNILTEDRRSQPIPKSVNVIAPENIFIEEGAKLEFVTLNASYWSNLYWKRF